MRGKRGAISYKVVIKTVTEERYIATGVIIVKTKRERLIVSLRVIDGKDRNVIFEAVVQVD